jgi:rhamnosyltransferase
MIKYPFSISRSSMKQLSIEPIPPLKSNTGAVVVTYNPDNDFPIRLSTIAEQVARVVVVDNKPNKQSRRILDHALEIEHVKLIQNGTNVGIATALNEGIFWLRERGYRWALTLDQDTVPAEQMLNTLLRVYRDCKHRERVAIIGSNYNDSISTPRFTFKSRVGYGCSYVEKKTVITSGSLLSIPLFTAIGPFRDEFFIDHVDHEYCLRARKQGFKIMLTKEPIMEHSIGTMVERRLPGMHMRISDHTAERYYYRSRNHAILIREYIFIDPIWVCKSIYSSLKTIITVVLFADKKISKLELIGIGYIHGIVKNMKRGPVL